MRHQSFLRRPSPLPSRTEPRPRLDSRNGPSPADAERPRFDILSRTGPSFFDLRKNSPTLALLAIPDNRFVLISKIAAQYDKNSAVTARRHGCHVRPPNTSRETTCRTTSSGTSGCASASFNQTPARPCTRAKAA